MSIDDLRNAINAERDEPDEFGLPLQFGSEIDGSARNQNRRFLGMTAGERAAVSVMIFMAVLVIGAALLVVTGRIVF